MSTQILVFAHDALGSPVHCRLIEAAWPLPSVRIADLGWDYADRPLDVVRERLRLETVDTVILQVGDSAVICPALTAWLLKVLAMDPTADSPGSIRPVVRRVGAVVVRSDPPTQGSRVRSATGLQALLKTLKRAVESVGIEWLSPQVIDPNVDARVIDAGVRDFTRRLEDHTALPGDPGRSAGSPGRMHGFGRRLSILSAGCALVCGIVQAGLPVLGDSPSVTGSAWSDLVTAWLGIGLITLLASVMVQKTPFDTRLHAAVAATLFAYQLLSALTPRPIATVLHAIPPIIIALGIVAAVALVLVERLESGRPGRARPGQRRGVSQ